MKENKHKLILINFNVLWILFALLRQMDLTKMSTGLWIAISVNAISLFFHTMLFVFIHKENLSLVL
jgi:hypothetical protein